MSRRSREMSPEEQHVFANALREFLGLGPLYGQDDNTAPRYSMRKRERAAVAAASESSAKPEAQPPTMIGNLNPHTPQSASVDCDTWRLDATG